MSSAPQAPTLLWVSAHGPGMRRTGARALVPGTPCRIQSRGWASSLALGLSFRARPPRPARELSNPPLQRQMEPSEKIASNGEQEPGWAGLGGGLCWPDVNSSLITPNWPNLFTDTWGDQLHLSPTEQASLPPAWKHFCSRDRSGQLTAGGEARSTHRPSPQDPGAGWGLPPSVFASPLSPNCEGHTI